MSATVGGDAAAERVANSRKVVARRASEVKLYEDFLKTFGAEVVQKYPSTPTVVDAAGLPMVEVWPVNRYRAGTMKKYLRWRYQTSVGIGQYRHIGLQRIRTILWDITVASLQHCTFTIGSRENFVARNLRRTRSESHTVTGGDAEVIRKMLDYTDSDFQGERLKKEAMIYWDVHYFYEILNAEKIFVSLASMLCAILAVYSLMGARPVRFLDKNSAARVQQDKEANDGTLPERERILGGAMLGDLTLTMCMDMSDRIHVAAELEYYVEKLEGGRIQTGVAALTPGLHTETIETEHTAQLARHLFRVCAFKRQNEVRVAGGSIEDQWDAVFLQRDLSFREDFLKRPLFAVVSGLDGSIDWDRGYTVGGVNNLFQWGARKCGIWAPIWSLKSLRAGMVSTMGCNGNEWESRKLQGHSPSSDTPQIYYQTKNYTLDTGRLQEGGKAEQFITMRAMRLRAIPERDLWKDDSVQVKSLLAASPVLQRALRMFPPLRSDRYA